ncbi:RNA polymerase sigma factor SigB [Microaerobacter geothermalis]|uniref:RNA polymerase sigma factor SigB n=1 Tax=Microaerobacter geothermalis TaxID=674972 RepID=UPI001F26D2DD|nr:RNA polymerase sigma factor SigB [Microaerobacter geothermalis]MCF6093751.1 RNA polymerase sigma factor SigB [Microaerobacter geothermalis]
MSVHSQPVPGGNELHQLLENYHRHPSQEIKTRIVTYYSDLVDNIAFRFASGKELKEDLYQVGMIGLLSAIDRFDPSLGKNFESFAIPTIIGEIKRHIRDKTWSVHVPRRIKELGPKIKRAVEDLTTELGHSPRIEEIASYLNLSEEVVLEAMEMGKSYQALSVDSAIEADGEGGTITLLDLIGQKEEGYEIVDKQLLLSKAFKVLTQREKEIIYLTFFENLSQKQAGDRLGISQMHVSRLQRRALEKLKSAIKVKSSE